MLRAAFWKHYNYNQHRAAQSNRGSNSFHTESATQHLQLHHASHKCHREIKELPYFPSRITGKSLQISKCQLCINTFQLCFICKQQLWGSRSHMLCEAFHTHWVLITPHTSDLHTYDTMEKSHHTLVSDRKQQNLRKQVLFLFFFI